MNEEITINIRPVDPNNNPALPNSFNLPPWVMGSDLEIQVNPMVSVLDLHGIIEQSKEDLEASDSTSRNKFISRHRLQLRVNGKAVVPSKENWTLRRLGIYNNMIIQVEPTVSGDWYWHSKDYYEEQFMTKVLEVLRSRTTTPKAIALSELSILVGFIPPPIQSNLKAFLRRYPEKVHIYCDFSGFESVYWVQETAHPYMGPTFGEFPIHIGTIQRFEPPDFDWEAYRDVDDMYRVESLEAGQEAEGAAEEVAQLMEEMLLKLEQAQPDDEFSDEEEDTESDPGEAESDSGEAGQGGEGDPGELLGDEEGAI
mmetsp:Transcript_28247/g.40223  ORF Transcript_28247/g.40223 Transcript_28247/m.40223 type:complete len:312 (+) Transcript_28247:24-959(+)